MAESWMRVEIDRVTDPEQRRAIEERLHHVLRDVRESVEDWPRMQATAAAVADELEASAPVGLPEEEVSEGIELLRWLADHHFTFLGYREYAAGPDAGRGRDRGGSRFRARSAARRPGAAVRARRHAPARSDARPARSSC